MRLRIELDNPREARVPINYQDRLAAVVYHLLDASDHDFSRFLHNEGYVLDGGRKRFKLFVFSGLRARPSQRRIDGDTLCFARGPLEWLVASPIETFLTHFATGLLAQGGIRVGSATFSVSRVETLARPEFGTTAKLSCLTPIVAAVARPEGGTQYLRPRDGEAFSEAVRRNLLLKHGLVHGEAPADDRLTLRFDEAYLARDKNGGTKKITFKEIDVVGALAPFTLTGSKELMRLAWECGLGEKNSAGFGMVDVKAGAETAG